MLEGRRTLSSVRLKTTFGIAVATRERRRLSDDRDHAKATQSRHR